MSAILAGAALREEIRAINAAAGTKEKDFDKTYLAWLFFNETRDKHIVEDTAYELHPEHVADEEDLLDRLESKARGQAEKELFDRFSLALQKRLEIPSFDKWLKAVLVGEINQMLESEDFSLPTTESSEPNTEVVSALEERLQSEAEPAKRLARHRLRLQAAFPEIAQLKGPSADKAPWKLDQKAIRQKACLQKLREAEARTEEAPADAKQDPYAALYCRFSPSLQYAIKHSLFERSEVEMVIAELNQLLRRVKPLFSEPVQKDLSTSPGRYTTKSRRRLDKAGNSEPPIECQLINTPGLTPVMRNRLWLQLAFPGQIAKVWDTLPVVYAWIHAQEKGRNALCLSGGGIRSATFGLGVLQGLAEANVLKRFDYLSTVSGGGYIGGWLSAWSRHSKEFAKVETGLTGQNPDALNPEPPQLRHLREYSNYLTPKLGITSADTWTLIATYVRNLVLNWLVFLPAIAALLALPRIALVVLRLTVVPSWVAYATLTLGLLLGISAIVYAALNRPSLRDSRNAIRGTDRFLFFCLAPLYGSSLCFAAVWAWLQNGQDHFSGFLETWKPGLDAPGPLPFVILGAALHILAWGVYAHRMKRGRGAELLFCILSGMVAGIVLWRGAVAWYTNFGSAPDLELFACFGTPYYLLSFAAGVFFFVGIASRVTEDTDREWWARMGAWMLLAAAAWGLFSTLVLFGPEWLLKLPKLLTALGGITGVATLVLSHSSVSPANKKEAGALGKKLLSTNLILALAAPIFVVMFVAALSLGTTFLVAEIPFGGEQLQCDGATLLSESDIQDLPHLAARFKAHAPTDEAASYLWKAFSTGLQTQLTDFDGRDTQTTSLRTSLTSELNAVIKQDWLAATGAFFLSDAVPEPLKDTLLSSADGQTRMQRNRYLLELQFPTDLATGRFDHRMITHNCPWLKILAIFIGLAAISAVLSNAIDINRFSLHAVYRNRLIRAYLGASNPDRRPNAFTGFDPADNLHMAELNRRPFHVVNMALNLVTGEKLAWQQRKAESFTATPLHAGNYRLGFRKVSEYATLGSNPGEDPEEAIEQGKEKTSGLTLGTAVTISGAAASPNMGYHSSPVLALLMTLFNVRLGAWLGNPGKAGEKSFRDGAPRSAFMHLVWEALGLTNEKAKYVYLSDGGHFENLGLYEMVLRRCRRIIVSDAGCDPGCTLEDLGNAIRKIRIDLGIPIEIEKFDIFCRNPNSNSKYCARATIKYSEVDGSHAKDGELLYIKPAIGGNEPKDVFNYKEQSPLFPHEPTSDQWFSESQFESYRALGKHIVGTISQAAQSISQAQLLQGHESDDALQLLMDAASRYLAEPFPELPNLAQARKTDMVFVGKATVGI